MTPAQIIMVKKTWQKVLPDTETAAVLYYSKLLHLDPEIETLFKGDVEIQGFQLIKVIAITIDQLERPAKAVPILQALGRRYSQYGIKPEHYQTMGYAFMWMLQQILDKDFTPYMKQAWGKTYVMMARIMRDAAHPPAQAA